MTETEWLTCTDPTLMLRYLRGKASDRQLRLIAVSFCRRIWDRITDEISRGAVEVAERFADERVSRKELRESRQMALGVSSNRYDFTPRFVEAAAATCLLDAMVAAVRTSQLAWVFGHSPDVAEQSQQTSFIRHITGNPFHPIVLDPTWLTSTVLALCQAAYDDKAFDCLPILADALEDAGCTNHDILNHCRQPGEHGRGCWCLDLLLNKK